MWLTVDNIQEKESTVINEIPLFPNIVGSGVAVGAVVSDTVGATNLDDSPIQVSNHLSVYLVLVRKFSLMRNAALLAKKLKIFFPWS